MSEAIIPPPATNFQNFKKTLKTKLKKKKKKKKKKLKKKKNKIKKKKRTQMICKGNEKNNKIGEKIRK